MRAIIATDGSASVTAGSTRCVREPAPPTGSQLSQSENTTIRTRPVQKIGIDNPKSEPSRARPSNSELGRTAEATPAAIPTRRSEERRVGKEGGGAWGRCDGEGEWQG